jgi:hypothetical protein
MVVVKCQFQGLVLKLPREVEESLNLVLLLNEYVVLMEDEILYVL